MIRDIRQMIFRAMAFLVWLFAIASILYCAGCDGDDGPISCDDPVCWSVKEEDGIVWCYHSPDDSGYSSREECAP